MGDSLKGKLLVASPAIVDPSFHRSVVLLADHDAEGAMGVVLNHMAGTTLGEAVPELAWLDRDDAEVHVGGPVAQNAVVVLAELERPSISALLIEADLGFVSAVAVEQEELEGAVRRARIFAGHAGWGPGQLEDELEEESWIVLEADREDVFCERADELWGDVLRRQHDRRYTLLATLPPDPSLN